MKVLRLIPVGVDPGVTWQSGKPVLFEDAVDYMDDALFVFQSGEIKVAAEKVLRGARLSGTPSNDDLQVYMDSVRFTGLLDGYRQRFGKLSEPDSRMLIA